MRLSIEDIYRYTGQFDKVATIIFANNSSSQKKFGNHITGRFLYTPKERRLIQNLLDTNSNSRTNGFLRFQEILKKLPLNLKEELEVKGIQSSDIIDILQFSGEEENKFKSRKTKQLPKALEIPVSYKNYDETDRLTLGLNNAKVKSGYKLCPFEIDEHNSILLRKYKDKISKENYTKFFVDSETGKIHRGIHYYYLKHKYYQDELSDSEQIEWEIHSKERIKLRLALLKRELGKASSKFKNLELNYNESLQRLLTLTIFFEPYRLTHNKFPVWLDYERFIHIFIKHVSETKLGERFEKSSVFNYKLRDIKGLIGSVLRVIEEQIQEHFETYPDKPFKRHGEMSIYFDGDYYIIDIAPNGRLMTFYKKN